MKRFVLAICFAASAATPAAAYTAADLYWDCSGRAAKAEIGMALCIGYVGGALDAYALNPKGQPFCLPSTGISREQAIRVFVAAIEKNPSNMHQSARIELLVALQKTFPCK